MYDVPEDDVLWMGPRWHGRFANFDGASHIGNLYGGYRSVTVFLATPSITSRRSSVGTLEPELPKYVNICFGKYVIYSRHAFLDINERLSADNMHMFYVDRMVSRSVTHGFLN